MSLDGPEGRRDPDEGRPTDRGRPAADEGGDAADGDPGEPRAAGALERLRERRDGMVELLVRLARIESPTDVPATQRGVQDVLAGAFERLDFRVRRLPGRASGGHLLAAPRARTRGRPLQLLLGHTDTVWPVGTLERMPVTAEGEVVRGPGTFDMKAGLVQLVFALGALRELGLEPPATPVVFLNSDEEVGSLESKRWVAALARGSCRAWVLEPAFGPEGRLKTARKGMADYDVTVRGRSAHAGLDPGAGASAIEALARLVVRLHALTDLERGLTVNVGVVRGGTRPNVIAAEAAARVDARALTHVDLDEVDRAVRALSTEVEGTSVSVSGGIGAPPLERTPRNRRLWEAARAAGRRLGLELREATVGGGSDGNTASLHTATLDGLGAVGDGAHATHEHVVVGRMVERTALLAELLMEPVAGEGMAGGGDR